MGGGKRTTHTETVGAGALDYAVGVRAFERCVKCLGLRNLGILDLPEEVAQALVRFLAAELFGSRCCICAVLEHR